jgi:hypothetical protein
MVATGLSLLMARVSIGGSLLAKSVFKENLKRVVDSKQISRPNWQRIIQCRAKLLAQLLREVFLLCMATTSQHVTSSSLRFEGLDWSRSFL